MQNPESDRFQNTNNMSFSLFHNVREMLCHCLACMEEYFRSAPVKPDEHFSEIPPGIFTL